MERFPKKVLRTVAAGALALGSFVMPEVANGRPNESNLDIFRYCVDGNGIHPTAFFRPTLGILQPRSALYVVYSDPTDVLGQERFLGVQREGFGETRYPEAYFLGINLPTRFAETFRVAGAEGENLGVTFSVYSAVDAQNPIISRRTEVPDCKGN